jgi:hypothetical protein
LESAKVAVRKTEQETYTTPPGPVARHEIIPSSLPSVINFNKRGIIKLPIEIGIIKEVADDTRWVAILDLV